MSKFPIPVEGIKTPITVLKAFDNTMCDMAEDSQISESLRDPMEVHIMYHDCDDPQNDLHIFAVNHNGELDVTFPGWFYQYMIVGEDGIEKWDEPFGPFDSPEELIEELKNPKRPYPQIVIEE